MRYAEDAAASRRPARADGVLIWPVVGDYIPQFQVGEGVLQVVVRHAGAQLDRGGHARLIGELGVASRVVV